MMDSFFAMQSQFNKCNELICTHFWPDCPICHPAAGVCLAVIFVYRRWIRNAVGLSPVLPIGKTGPAQALQDQAWAGGVIRSDQSWSDSCFIPFCI